MRFPVSAALTILLWSLFPIMISRVETLNSFQAVILAQALSLFVWVIYLLARREQFFRIYKAAIYMRWPILASGVCNAVEYVAFFAALRNTNPIAPTVVFETWIIFMAIFNIAILGVRLRRMEMGIIGLAFLGVALSIIDPQTGFSELQSLDVWALLGVAAALCAGLKASLNVKIANHYTTMTKSAFLIPHLLTVQVALAVYAVYAVFLTDAPFSASGFYTDLVGMPGDDAVRLFIIGAVIMGAANPLFISSLQKKPTEAHSAVFYLIPLVATGWLIYFGDNEVTYYIASGGFITLIAILVLTVHGVRFDAMVGAAIVSLLAAYVIITFQNFVDIPQLVMSDHFFVEIAILVFSLIGVFSVERVTTVRHAHEDSTQRVVEALLSVYQTAQNSRAKHLLDDIATRVTMIEFSSQRRLPVNIATEICQLIRLFESPAQPTRHAENALHEWLGTRARFYPKSHIGFVTLFGFVCCTGIVLTATNSAISPLFSLLIVSGISYLVFYIIHLNNPALQDSAQILQPYRLFQEINRFPLIPERQLSTTWVRNNHINDFRVFSGDPVKDGTWKTTESTTVRVREPEPWFVRYFSEFLFVTSMTVSIMAVLLA